MTRRAWIVGPAFALLLCAGGYGLYQLGMKRGQDMGALPPGPTGSPAQQNMTDGSGKKILYWHDPMVPGQKFDKPGKSPFMDMQLVPVYADGEDAGMVTISPRMQQNLGVRTAEVKLGALAQQLEAVGSVAYNDRDVAVVQARSNGFVEKLYARAPFDAVRKRQALAEIYVPDWVAAQEDYLSAKRVAGGGLADIGKTLEDGARQRMRLAGMTEEQIREVESTGVVHARLTISAPIDGVVTELGAREGMTIMAGTTLFRLNGLRTVWINAEVPENAAAGLRVGRVVHARAAALPGVVFEGRVSEILPEVAPATRTLKVRIEMANANARLVPGMFVTVDFTPGGARQALQVPTEAVIRTGKRAVVIVTQGDGRFVPVDVEPGIESGGQTEILKGLAAGQQVVVSGQFLIDSEASLKGIVTRMEDGAAPKEPRK